MKYKLVFFTLVLLPNIVFSQIEIDTIFSIDSIFRNDTLFIIKTKHLRYTINDSTSNFARISKKADNKLSDIDAHLNLLEITDNQGFKYRKGFRPVIKKYLSFGFSPEYNFAQKECIYKLPKFYFNTNIGYGLSIFSKNFALSTGGFYLYQSNPQSITDEWYEIKNTNRTYIEHNYYWDVDTVWFLNLDSLLEGDTVYFPYYDSTLIHSADTFVVQRSDTTSFSYKGKNINALHKISVPIIFSKYFKYKRSKLFISVGAIFNYNFYTSSYLYSPVIHSYTKIFYSKFQIYMFNELSYEYFFKPKKISTFFSIYGTMPVLSEYNFGQNTNDLKIGIGVGFRYYLKK